MSSSKAPEAGHAARVQRLLDLAQRALAVTRRAVVAGVRRLWHLWRSSLQFRVVVSTMLLGLVVVLALGSYLYQRIANGLRRRPDRAGPAGRAAGRTVRPDAVRRDRQHRRHEHDPLATDIAAQLASPGADQSRDIILVRSGAATSPAKVPTILSGDVGLPSIPAELREAVSADPGRQQTQVISVTSEQTGEAVPAVVVGSQITLPTAGRYELYFVFPMDREQATLAVVSPHLRPRRHRAGPARRRRRLRGHPRSSSTPYVTPPSSPNGSPRAGSTSG